MKLENFYQELDSLFRNGNVKEAEQYIMRIMEQVRQDGDLPALLSIANELGGVFRVTGRLEEAKKIYAVALETIRLLSLDNTEQHGTTLLNLASVFTEGKEALKALALYEQAASIFEKRGLQSDYRMAALYNNISHVHDLLENRDQALSYAEKALAVIKQLRGYDVELATTYSTVGVRYLKKQDYEAAEKALTEAERIFTSLPGKTNVHYAAVLNALGDLHFRRQKYDEAVSFFERARMLIEKNYGKNSSYEEISNNLAKAREMQEVQKHNGIDRDRTDGKLQSQWVGQQSCSPSKTERPDGGAVSMRMTGMGLAEAFYHEFGQPMIREQFPEYEKYMAIGLVGEGSECFGYDDALSESHDFGPGFCIWLPDSIYQSVGARIQQAYDQLPKTYRNQFRAETEEGSGRVGVFSISEFYRKYTGCADIPKDAVEWLFVPETSLATVTNGKIFVDHCGEFSRIRSGLLNFYPKDIYLKKLAARMAMMSQSGQYNYMRCMKRGEYGAAYLSCGEFIKNTVSTVYLLNKSYMPFYKWMLRGMGKLERLKEIKPMLEQLAATPDLPEHGERKAELIESVCIKVRDELKHQGLISGTDAFLNSHCRDLMSRINDPRIKGLPVMFDGK